MSTPDPETRLSFYTSALLCLRFIEARKVTGRRFGPDADALWGAFCGHLTTADRIDVLLRDADAEWPGTFGARTAFALRATAEDEPFGAEWPSLDPIDAETLWRTLPEMSPPASGRELFAACAAAWGETLTPFDAGPIDANVKLVVAGPSAIAAAALACAGEETLSWSQQVVCIATPPAHRQLAALAAAIINALEPTRLATFDEPLDLEPGSRLLASGDAAPEDLERARRLVSP
ncbi:MAG: hypothetical protein GY856_33800 [bacterium]|nr:hypothetical protein [bacterium]